MLPIVGYDFGEQTRQDAEVADGKYVDVDHMAQTMSNCRKNTEKSKQSMKETEAFNISFSVFSV